MDEKFFTAISATKIVRYQYEALSFILLPLKK